MDREQSKMRLFQAGIEAMSADERAALKAAMEPGEGRWGLGNAGTHSGHSLCPGQKPGRRDSDKRTDAKRRVLVGAHVPRGLARAGKGGCGCKGGITIPVSG